MARVVRETVVAEVDAVVVAGTEVCVCADARTAANKMARDSFFTTVLDLGENLEISNHLYGGGYEGE
jgi:hypothetical protein